MCSTVNLYKILKTTVDIAKEITGNSCIYITLYIFSSGVINDINNLKNLLTLVSELPISIIIIKVNDNTKHDCYNLLSESVARTSFNRKYISVFEFSKISPKSEFEIDLPKQITPFYKKKSIHLNTDDHESIINKYLKIQEENFNNEVKNLKLKLEDEYLVKRAKIAENSANAIKDFLS